MHLARRIIQISEPVRACPGPEAAVSLLPKLVRVQPLSKGDHRRVKSERAEWCGPCRAIAPVLDELSSELEGKVKMVNLNVDENPGIAAQYGVRSIPTMILFKGGEAADMKIGAGTPKAGLTKWLEGHAA